MVSYAPRPMFMDEISLSIIKSLWLGLKRMFDQQCWLVGKECWAGKRVGGSYIDDERSDGGLT